MDAIAFCVVDDSKRPSANVGKLDGPCCGVPIWPGWPRVQKCGNGVAALLAKRGPTTWIITATNLSMLCTKGAQMVCQTRRGRMVAVRLVLRVQRYLFQQRPRQRQTCPPQRGTPPATTLEMRRHRPAATAPSPAASVPAAVAPLRQRKGHLRRRQLPTCRSWRGIAHGAPPQRAGEGRLVRGRPARPGRTPSQRNALPGPSPTRRCCVH